MRRVVDVLWKAERKAAVDGRCEITRILSFVGQRTNKEAPLEVGRNL